MVENASTILVFVSTPSLELTVELVFVSTSVVPATFVYKYVALDYSLGCVV